jgi:hypothetical protein
LREGCFELREDDFDVIQDFLVHFELIRTVIEEILAYLTSGVRDWFVVCWSPCAAEVHADREDEEFVPDASVSTNHQLGLGLSDVG